MPVLLPGGAPAASPRGRLSSSGTGRTALLIVVPGAAARSDGVEAAGHAAPLGSARIVGERGDAGPPAAGFRYRSPLPADRAQAVATRVAKTITFSR
ncbi:hypothetical protein HGI15_17445 [Modestobacter lapidis]|nr:hypothetical protein [Modestobacter lapidis]